VRSLLSLFDCLLVFCFQVLLLFTPVVLFSLAARVCFRFGRLLPPFCPRWFQFVILRCSAALDKLFGLEGGNKRHVRAFDNLAHFRQHTLLSTTYTHTWKVGVLVAALLASFSRIPGGGWAWGFVKDLRK
jgi:hypothetical protein